MQARGEAPEARAALSDLCEAYDTPVLRFLLREGKNEDEAGELTQSFFARVLSTNSRQHADPNKGRFRSYLLGALKPWLTGDADSFSQEEAATTLMISRGAVKVAIHRLRKDFNEAIRAEIAQTVNTPEEVTEELHYLIKALSSARAAGLG